MGCEPDIVAKTSAPVTVESLRRDLLALGVEPGMVLLVHSSLSALGWVCGGPVAVVIALQEVLGEDGTLVMPMHSASLSDPAAWANPPVPQDWWQTIRDTMPAYDVAYSPTQGMGLIVEVFRRWPGAVRSRHPQHSFCARGPLAHKIVEEYALHYGLGEESPLAKVNGLGGSVLLLGVGDANNTSLHLAEYRAEFAGKKIVQNGAPITTEVGREWVVLQDLDIEDEDFARLGADYEAQTDAVGIASVGRGEARLFAQRDIVDFAVGWMRQNRT